MRDYFYFKAAGLFVHSRWLRLLGWMARRLLRLGGRIQAVGVFLAAAATEKRKP